MDHACATAGSPQYRLGRDIEWRLSSGRLSSGPSDAAGAAVEAKSAVESGADEQDGEADQSIDVKTPWTHCLDVPVPLRGLHQADNAALAVATASLLATRGLEIASHAVRSGMSAVRWPARIEVIARSPTVVVDAAHNWASTEALIRTLCEQFAARRRLLIFAGTKDKDVAGLLRLLLPRFDSVILTQYETNPRAVPVDEMAALAHATSMRPFHVGKNAQAAWQMARQLASPEDLICITGSFFIATELRTLVLEQQSAVRQDSM
jgi:dihydrofolate synthase/folylpolyglutamate synthase